MARIDVLPSIEIIRGFKGILDFYVWRGLPCVRAWPQYRPARQTDASLAAALLFGAIVKAYSLLAEAALEAYRDDAADHNRTARDIMVSGVYGKLHEASMSDFLDALIIIRDSIVSLTDLLHALDSVDTDEIVVNVDQSVLPPLAATTTNQATVITALQNIDDLQDALESKALDRLLVRGMDQLISFHDRLFSYAQNTDTTAGTVYLNSTPVPSGEIWLFTDIRAYFTVGACTSIHLYDTNRTDTHHFETDPTPIAYQGIHWQGFMPMTQPNRLRAIFFGCTLHSSIHINIHGFKMTLET